MLFFGHSNCECPPLMMGRASAAERCTMWQGTRVARHTETTVLMAASSMLGGRDCRNVEYRSGSQLPW